MSPLPGPKVSLYGWARNISLREERRKNRAYAKQTPMDSNDLNTLSRTRKEYEAYAEGRFFSVHPAMSMVEDPPALHVDRELSQNRRAPSCASSLAPVASAEAFGHQALPSGHIRLLNFNSISPLGRIELRLSHHSLEECPEYVALSYVWGTRTSQLLEVGINGKTFGLQINLYNALRRLIQRTDSSMLWVDAICIDQRNIDERNYQVKLMDQIFRGAANVAAWLGEISEDEARTLSDWDGSRTHLWSNTKYIEGVSTRLARSPLFTRVWCLQELIIPENVTFHCSEQVLTLESFTILVDWAKSGTLPTSYTAPDAAIQTIGLAADLLRVRAEMRVQPGRSMRYLLETFGNSLCTDPRDKIFALLSLLTPEDEFRGIFPDYSLSITGVVLETVKEFRRQASALWETHQAIEGCAIVLDVFGLEPTIHTKVMKPLRQLRFQATSLAAGDFSFASEKFVRRVLGSALPVIVLHGCDLPVMELWLACCLATPRSAVASADA
ncbi:hypothetical protein LTR56_020687 [Elasticomyces elasticus]|nr:hypothetical protein LTR56_020687 [Elasticomyces elasticus]KAK3653096.1 hypothetical protein LTR22_011334 [Elasticomyces elasticus]KAK4919662.1 hypothetical protein LTR49_012726 [Elasticomyces elasticus]KAK5751249.1 hypothetical protein LTS12_018723 [Elasticomyces elasticus]